MRRGGVGSFSMLFILERRLACFLELLEAVAAAEFFMDFTEENEQEEEVEDGDEEDEGEESFG